jgi:hypothetical protein
MNINPFGALVVAKEKDLRELFHDTLKDMACTRFG